LILGGTKHWEKDRSDEETGSANTWRPPYIQSRSVDIEMTAYALLVHSLNGDLSGAVPIAKWIISQRNPNGGFSSTQVIIQHSVITGGGDLKHASFKDIICGQQ